MLKAMFESVKRFFIKLIKGPEKVSPRRRLFVRGMFIFGIVAVVVLLTVANLVRIQIIDAESYRSKAQKNQLHDTEIAASRGIIYDANGTVLAKSASVWKVYVLPNAFAQVQKKEDFSDEVREDFKNDLCRNLAPVIGVEFDTIKNKANTTKYSYLVLKKQIELAEKEKVAEFLKKSYKYTKTYVNDDGEVINEEKKIYYSSVVGIDPDVKRYYPYGNLAANVIGFTGTDDVGRLGVELKYDSTLTGTPGRIVTARNGKSDVMSEQFETIHDPIQGTSLVLTIDEVIQRYLEDSLRQVYIDSKGVGAYGVVMDVETGAILAMANMGNFNLNSPNALTEEEEKMLLETYPDKDERDSARDNLLYAKWRNFIVSDSYEPGSVFKIVTAAAAVEENVLREDFSYNCTGKITVADRIIQCHNRDGGHGVQDLKHGLMNSCNPLFITVGQTLGKEKFFEYFEAFGFTEKTGIDLPAELKPVEGVNYHSLESMGIVELSSSSFGQSFQVTPIQMVTAISAVANGGYLMQPYVVARQLDENNNVISETQPHIRRQVISEETAAEVTDMMEAVVTSGTGKNAYVTGYRVAGKTGTSQKLGSDGEYVASFGCFAPANDPEIAVLILVDEPEGQINGGQICTPVAAQVVEKTLEYMGVERQYNDKELEKLDTLTPSLVGKSTEDALALLDEKGFKVKVVGEGEKVISQMPSYNHSVPQNGIIVLYTEKDVERVTVEVPDLTMMTLSAVNKYALSTGLNIKVSGNALNAAELISYDQNIEAGQTVEYGSTITVYFKSDTGVNDYAG